MKLLSLIVGTALLATTAPLGARETPSPEEKLAAITAGRVAGRPVSCINQRDIGSTDIIAGVGVVYRMRNGTVYINRPAGGVSGFDTDDIMITRTISTQLCRIDIVQLLDRNSRFITGSFSLNDFEPYSRLPKKQSID